MYIISKLDKESNLVTILDQCTFKTRQDAFSKVLQDLNKTQKKYINKIKEKEVVECYVENYMYGKTLKFIYQIQFIKDPPHKKM